MTEIVEFIEDPVLRQLARSAQQIAHRGSMFSLGRAGYQILRPRHPVSTSGAREYSR